MKKCEKLVLVLCFLFSSNLWAQDSLSQEIRPILRKNVIRAELWVQGGIGYERLFWQKGKHKISASVILNTRRLERTDSLPNLSYSFRSYFVGTSFHYLYGKRNHHWEFSLQYNLGSSAVLQGDWLRGRALPWGQYYVSGGYNSHYHNTSYVQPEHLLNRPDVKRMIEQKENFYIDNRSYRPYWFHQAAFRVGYRYQRTNGGFFFRVGLSLANVIWYSDGTPAHMTVLGTTKNTFDNIALPYLGLGWSF